MLTSTNPNFSRVVGPGLDVRKSKNATEKHVVDPAWLLACGLHR
jgi:hypothetical protein